MDKITDGRMLVTKGLVKKFNSYAQKILAHFVAMVVSKQSFSGSVIGVNGQQKLIILLICLALKKSI